MSLALGVARTGLDAQETAISVISNNLANVNTIGYKESRPVFKSLMYQNIRQPGAQSSNDTRLPSGLMLGTGVSTAATQKVFTQGSVIQTKNKFHVAVNGPGFFQVLMPDGRITYTRDGEFQPNENGQLVTASGYPLQPAITIPPNSTGFSVGRDGVVTAIPQGATEPTQLGTLDIANVVNPAGLQPIGDNLYESTAASGDIQVGAPGTNGMGTLEQGTLEGSNVNVVTELVSLIETQRAYEMNSKAISTVDKMMQYSDEVI